MENHTKLSLTPSEALLRNIKKTKRCLRVRPDSDISDILNLLERPPLPLKETERLGIPKNREQINIYQ